MPNALRSLTAFAIALSALWWATPCLLLQGEISLHVPEPAVTHVGHDHAMMDHAKPEAPTKSADADAHAHHQHEAPVEEPDAEWKPACPCGCDELPQPGTPNARIGYALIPLTLGDSARPAIASVVAAEVLAPGRLVHAIDHVPISS